jgi:hypothetical protein
MLGRILDGADSPSPPSGLGRRKKAQISAVPSGLIGRIATISLSLSNQGTRNFRLGAIYLFR